MQSVRIVDVIEIGKAWSGHPVPFSLITHGKEQYVAYYDENRDITIARRNLNQRSWDYARPSGMSPVFTDKATSTRTGWDSHNYIAMGFDGAGHIHLTGNMHADPLLYFRTDRPGDIHSFKRLDRLTGSREEHVTYPRYHNTAQGELIFVYRDGYSGNGADLWNIYDTASQTWRRLLDTPLADGREPINGQTANAYIVGPVKGPDGWFHIAWVWRDTYHCETNHSLSYARSRDLLRWEDSTGRPLTLPITRLTGEVVDPIPVNGGIINNNTLIGFDEQSKVILTYHKFDAAGNTQVYNARREGGERGQWRIVQASNWKFRWYFAGGGTILFDAKLRPVEVEGTSGRLRQS
jgi:hypothetical protein